MISLEQGSHASWKVLDFFLKIPGPEKPWKTTLVLENVLESHAFFLVVQMENKQQLCSTQFVLTTEF